MWGVVGIHAQRKEVHVMNTKDLDRFGDKSFSWIKPRLVIIRSCAQYTYFNRVVKLCDALPEMDLELSVFCLKKDIEKLLLASL